MNQLCQVLLDLPYGSDIRVLLYYTILGVLWYQFCSPGILSDENRPATSSQNIVSCQNVNKTSLVKDITFYDEIVHLSDIFVMIMAKMVFTIRFYCLALIFLTKN